MKTRFKILVYVFGCMLFTVACSEETKKKIKDAKQGVSATTSIVKGATTMQTEMERLRKLIPVTNEQLKTWLPESVGDLNRTGFKVGQTGYMKISSVEGTYKASDGKKKLSVMVMDGAGPTGSMMAPSYGLIGSIESEMEDENKHQKTVTVHGITAKQTFYKKRNKTQLMFLYEKRFLVTINSNEMNPKETWAMVKKMNLDKLAKQAK